MSIPRILRRLDIVNSTSIRHPFLTRTHADVILNFFPMLKTREIFMKNYLIAESNIKNFCKKVQNYCIIVKNMTSYN